MSNQYIDIVFDGPPSHESGRFVEVENEQGRSINAGEWIKPLPSFDDGPDFWRLRIHTDRGINSLAKAANDQAIKSGFHEPDMKKTPLEEVALWVSECAEAMEETRTGVPLDRPWYNLKLDDRDSLTDEEAGIIRKVVEAQALISELGAKADVADVLPTDDEWRLLVRSGLAKPEGFGIEAADVVIRIMDSMVDKGIDLHDMITLKMAYNATREPRHGKTK